jgi:hypothetical protein
VLLSGAADRDVGGRSVFAVEGGGAGMDGVKFGAGLEEADAAVPAEDTVVISGGADFFGFGEAAQGLFNERKKNVRGTAGVKLGFGAAFVEKAGVIVALVRIAERLKDGLDFGVAVGGKAGELVSDGQAEHAPSELVIGIDNEDIAADGFGFFGLVEVAVELDFGDGFGNACLGNGFELMRHGTSCFRGPQVTQTSVCATPVCYLPRTLRKSMVNGS